MTEKPAKLLIIDDEERGRDLLQAFLDDFDEFETKGVSSAEEALRELYREPYDLCIVDMRLPGMNGQDFILTALSSGLCSRFLLHTGSIDYSLPEQLFRHGLTNEDILYKPCDTKLLLGRIRNKLRTTGTTNGYPYY